MAPTPTPGDSPGWTARPGETVMAAGHTIGPWEVSRVLGRGRGGDLLLLRDRDEQGRWQAARVVPPHVTDPRGVAHAAVDTPAVAHLITSHDILVADDGTILVTVDLVEAGTLATIRDERGLFSAGEIVTAFAPLAGALARLHGLGRVHGGVDLGHILLDTRGRPWLSDLCGATARRDHPTLVGDDTLTFEAPVRVAAADGAARRDVAGVGAAAWACLTGTRLTPSETWRRPSLARLRPDLPAALVGAVDDAVHPDPARRPRARDLEARLLGAATPEPLPLPNEDGGVTRRIPERFREPDTRPGRG